MHISIKKKILFQFMYKTINVYTSCYHTVEVNQGFGLIKEVVPLSYVEIETEALLFQPLSQFRFLNIQTEKCY